MWLAVVASSLSVVFFCVAAVLTWQVGDERETGVRRHEGAAALFVGLGVLLLLIAVVFWLKYLIFGPIGDWFGETISDDEVHQ